MNPFSLIKTFKCYFHSFLMNTIPCSKIVLSQHEQINEYGMFTYSQTRSAKVSIYCTPQDSISIGSCRFQIQLRILVWIISREVTREAVDVCNLRNFHSKDFQPYQIQRSSCKIFTAHYTHRSSELNLTLVIREQLTNSFFKVIIKSSRGYA